MGIAHNLDELKHLVGPLTVYQDYVKLAPRGKRGVGLCPFHKEKTPSFSVDLDNGLFYCFGCHKGGDMIQFIQELEGVSFKESVDLIARKAGVTVEWRGASRDQAPDHKERLRACLQSAQGYYRASLSAAAKEVPVRAYATRRGIAKDTEELLQLGFSPLGGGLLAHLKRAGFSAEESQEAGLVMERGRGEWSERFRNRLMFPIVDLLGRTVGFGGRALGDDEPKYLNSPETPVFQKREVLYGLNWAKAAAKEHDQIVLVEGYMDFLSVYQAGIKNVAATLGTALAEGQVKLVRRYAREAVLNFDRDAAGVAAARRAIQILLGEGLRIRVVTVPGEKDPDAFIKVKGPEAYAGLVAAAPPFFDFLVALGRPALAKGGPAAKTAFLDDILPYLAAVADPIERQEYAKDVAGRASIDPALVMAKLGKMLAGGKDPSPEIRSESHAVSASEQFLVKGLMNPAQRATAQGLVRGLPDEVLNGLLSAPLLRALAAGQGPDGPEQTALLAYIQNAFHMDPSDEDLHNAVRQISDGYLMGTRRRLQQQIREAGQKGDLGLVQILSREMMAVSEQIGVFDTGPLPQNQESAS